MSPLSIRSVFLLKSAAYWPTEWTCLIILGARHYMPIASSRALGEPPVQGPAKFEFVINLKTAGRAVSHGEPWVVPHRAYVAGLFDKPGPEQPLPAHSRPIDSHWVHTELFLLVVRTASGFSRVSSTSSVSWRITRRSPSRNAYSTFSRPISTSSSWPR
jgi:hypothetical protein